MIILTNFHSINNYNMQIIVKYKKQGQKKQKICKNNKKEPSKYKVTKKSS